MRQSHGTPGLISQMEDAAGLTEEIEKAVMSLGNEPRFPFLGRLQDHLRDLLPDSEGPLLLAGVSLGYILCTEQLRGGLYEKIHSNLTSDV